MGQFVTRKWSRDKNKIGEEFKFRSSKSFQFKTSSYNIFNRLKRSLRRLTVSQFILRGIPSVISCIVCLQFESDGCDNCENFLHLKRNRDNVYDCTSATFDGMIAACKPRDSWVCKVRIVTMHFVKKNK